jgi:hypothetical protein
MIGVVAFAGHSTATVLIALAASLPIALMSHPATRQLGGWMAILFGSVTALYFLIVSALLTLAALIGFSDSANSPWSQVLGLWSATALASLYIAGGIRALRALR